MRTLVASGHESDQSRPDKERQTLCDLTYKWNPGLRDERKFFYHRCLRVIKRGWPTVTQLQKGSGEL